MIVRSRFHRPDVVCPFYAYPIAASASLLAASYAIRAGSMLVKASLYQLIFDSITATSLAICAFYVREMLAEVAVMPDPRHTRATNAELARVVTQLTEDQG